MASYLLKTTESELDEWKAAADKLGVTFAEWLREAAREHVRRAPTVVKAKQSRGAQAQQRPVGDLGSREVTTYFKKERGR